MTAPFAAEEHTGFALAEEAWLDRHFEACQGHYARMLASAEIQPGWRVLDAGCGTGSFLKLLAEAVGPSGELVALDASPAHTEAIRRRAQAYRCRVEVATSVLPTLPFRDAEFDAVWSANVIQYLSDEDLTRTLAELRRIVRPGGVIAIKDFDGSHARIHPGDPALLWRLLEAVRRSPAHFFHQMAHGILRTATFRRWLERAGLCHVRQATTLMELWGPCGETEQAWMESYLEFWAAAAEPLDLPAADLEYWAKIRSLGARVVVNDPDFYCCEPNTIAVGTVPSVST
jgi:ubiquinone/menaquinone biosynthesis C-methylase UbiE